jgi:hypothetical protein
MTSNTSNIPAATGGSGATSDDVKPRGLIVVRRSEGECLTRIVLDTLWETSHLVSEMDQGVGPEAGKVATERMQHLLLEALTCLETADKYLRMLDGVIDTGEPLSDEPITLR